MESPWISVNIYSKVLQYKVHFNDQKSMYNYSHYQSFYSNNYMLLSLNKKIIVSHTFLVEETFFDEIDRTIYDY